MRITVCTIVHCTMYTYLGAGEYIWSSLYIFSLSYEYYCNYTQFYLKNYILAWKIKTWRRRNFFYFDGLNLTDSMSHCNENWIYVFTEKELRGLSPNSYVHVSESDLYIPRICPHIWLQQKRQTYPSLIELGDRTL